MFSMPSDQTQREQEVANLLARAADPNDPYDALHIDGRGE